MQKILTLSMTEETQAPGQDRLSPKMPLQRSCYKAPLLANSCYEAGTELRVLRQVKELGIIKGGNSLHSSQLASDFRHS